MISVDLNNVESELKKRHQYPYQWFRKQNDQWDLFTNFIYQTPEWETFLLKINRLLEAHKVEKEHLFQYAANRWYNFWSAQAVEFIFKSLHGIEGVPIKKDSEKDFFLFGIPFDHKTSVFPKQFGKSFEYAQNHKDELMQWLYKNQSTQKRYHLKNRLFIVVYDNNGAHWKLKGEIQLLKKVIEGYIATFKSEQLYTISFDDERTALSDIIWVTK